METNATFEKAFKILMEKEGGAKITNDPTDRGGLTKYGISKRAYPQKDIAKLTEEEAKMIYFNDYWTPLKLNEEGEELAIFAFLQSVNFGVAPVLKILTVIRNQTLTKEAVEMMSFKFLCILRYVGIVNKDQSQSKFLRGWLNRILF